MTTVLKMAETRKEISTLLRASMPFQRIKEVTGASRSTVFRVKRRLQDGQDLEHQYGGGRPRSAATEDTKKS